MRFRPVELNRRCMATSSVLRLCNDNNVSVLICFRINEVEIILDELNTTFSSEVGSDHFTRVYAPLGPAGGFDDVGVEEWLAKLKEVQTIR